jgi:hypothetical protein
MHSEAMHGGFGDCSAPKAAEKNSWGAQQPCMTNTGFSGLLGRAAEKNSGVRSSLNKVKDYQAFPDPA